MTLLFQQPALLLLLLAVPLLALWLRRQGRRRLGTLPIPSLVLIAGLPVAPRVQWTKVLAPLRWGGLVLLVVASAGPQIGQAEASLVAEGIDIVLALDLSYSMKERDFGFESRAEGAKRVVKEFIAGRKNDRLGVVVFAGESVVQSPLTLDYDALQKLIDPLEAGGLPGGTAIGMALANALNVLRESRSKTKVIVLLSDGENNAGEVSPQQAAQMAKTLQIRIYTIGLIGGEAARFPGERRPSSFGQRAAEEDLMTIARIAGGAYFRATDEESLRQIYQQIDRLEKSRVGERRYSDLRELTLYALVPAFALLLVEALLSTTLLRRVP